MTQCCFRTPLQNSCGGCLFPRVKTSKQVRHLGGKHENICRNHYQNLPRKRNLLSIRMGCIFFKKQARFSFPDATAQLFLYRLNFYSVQYLIWMSEKGLKGCLGMLSIQSSYLTPSTVLDVLQFLRHSQENLSQTQQNNEGFKQKNLRKQKLHGKATRCLKARHFFITWLRQKTFLCLVFF